MLLGCSFTTHPLPPAPRALPKSKGTHAMVLSISVTQETAAARAGLLRDSQLPEFQYMCRFSSTHSMILEFQAADHTQLPFLLFHVCLQLITSWTVSTTHALVN